MPISRWTGSTWKEIYNVRYWDGTQWAEARHVYYWNGSSWIEIWAAFIPFSYVGGHQFGEDLHKIDEEGNQVWVNSENVNSLEVEPDGYVYLGSDTGYIEKIDPSDGSRVWYASPTLGNNVQIGLDGSRNVFVNSSSEDYVYRYDKNGNQDWEVNPENSQGSALSAGSYCWAGQYYASYKLYKSDGSVHSYFDHSVSNPAQSLANDGGFECWLGDTEGNLRELDSSMNLSWAVSAGSGYVRGIAADSSYLYVASEDGLIKFDKNGNKQWTYRSAMTMRDVTVDPDGYVYVVTGDPALEKVDQDGNLVWQYLVTDSVYATTVLPGTYAAFASESKEW